MNSFGKRPRHMLGLESLTPSPRCASRRPGIFFLGKVRAHRNIHSFSLDDSRRTTWIEDSLNTRRERRHRLGHLLSGKRIASSRSSSSKGPRR